MSALCSRPYLFAGKIDVLSTTLSPPHRMGVPSGMFRYFFLGLFAWTISAAWAQDVFQPINSTNGFAALPSCEQNCLAMRLNSEDVAKNSCPSLSSVQMGLGICQTGCTGDDDSVKSSASSIMDVFCTSVAKAYSLSISAATTSSSAVNTLTTTNAAIASSDSTLMGVTTPTVAETTTTGPATSSATGPVANDPTAAPANGTSTTALPSSKKGLSSGAKAGLGAGLGLGLSFLLLGVAAYTLVRMRKGRAARGPYGQVTSGEKGMNESASYSSPRVEPHELHPMSPTVPFLPPSAVQDASPRTHQYHDRPTTAQSQRAEYSAVEPVSAVTQKSRDFLSTPQEPMPGQARPATSRDVSRPATPPSLNTSVRPATAQAHYGSAGMDEPPSPISPVSPISPAGSRPASFLNERDHHHDS